VGCPSHPWGSKNSSLASPELPDLPLWAGGTPTLSSTGKESNQHDAKSLIVSLESPREIRRATPKDRPGWGRLGKGDPRLSLILKGESVNPGDRPALSPYTLAIYALALQRMSERNLQNPLMEKPGKPRLKAPGSVPCSQPLEGRELFGIAEPHHSVWIPARLNGSRSPTSP